GGAIRLTDFDGSQIIGWSITNAGLVEADNAANINFLNCSITSTSGAQWNTGSGLSNVGLEFRNPHLQGVFNGDAQRVGSIRLNGAIVIDDDTTFNITGVGINRWVASSVAVATGKTLTNAGVFNHLNDCEFAGNIVNNGTWNFLNGST